MNDAAKLIKPGAKLIVKGGYQERKELFYGYVDDFSIDFNSDKTPFIQVNGIDGLGYLMNMYTPLYAGEKKPKEIVQAILQKSQSAGYAKSIKVGSLDGFETPIIKELTDDWKFLCTLAERYGTMLFAVDGELIFDNVLTKTSPILTLTVGKSVRHFSRRVSLSHQVGKVEVMGRDVNQVAVMGSASSVKQLTSKALRTMYSPFSKSFWYSRDCSRPVTRSRSPTWNRAANWAFRPHAMQGM